MTAYTPDTLFHTYITQLQHSRRALTNISRTSQAMFHAGINTYRHLLTTTWDNLTDQEAIHELTLGTKSLFYPLFMDDPRLGAYCNGDCQRTVVVGPSGICDTCGKDLSE